jgi:hypothetical protein
MNSKSELNTTQFALRGNRLIALSVAGLYGTASLLSGTTLVWVIQSGILVRAAVGQTAGDLPASAQNLGDRASVTDSYPP